MARALSPCVAVISRTAHAVSLETQLVILTSPPSSSYLGDRANRPPASRTGSSLQLSLQPFLRSSLGFKVRRGGYLIFFGKRHTSDKVFWKLDLQILSVI